MEVEDVVDVDAKHQLLDALVLEGEDVVGREVARREAGQRTLLALRVVEVLARHVVGVPRGCQSVLLVGDEAVEDHRGREGQRAVVVMDHVEAIAVVGFATGVGVTLPVVPVLNMLVEVLDLVLADGRVALDGQAGKDGPGSGEFHAQTVRLVDVCCEVFADVAQLAGLHKLVLVVHPVERRAYRPIPAGIAVAEFCVDERLGLGSRIRAIVGEVVAFGLTMAVGHRKEGAMTVVVPCEAGFRVEEVVALVDVEALVDVSACVVVESVVDAVGLVAYVPVLHIAEDVQLVGKVISSLCEDVVVILRGIRVVVLVVAVRQILLHHGRMGCIGDVAEVVTVEALQRQASDDVPLLTLVVGIPHQAVSVLLQSLLAHEVALLDVRTIGFGSRHAERREFLVVAELVVVAVAMRVVQRCRGGPLVVDLPGQREDGAVLPEVVGGLVPIRSVRHPVALGALRGVAAIHQVLVERVVFAEPSLIEVLVFEQAGAHASVVPVEQVACVQSVPGLAHLLEVAEVLEADHELVAHVGQSAVV